MTKNKEKVLLGMSGGVDSSVAAYLLLKKGFDVIGVTLEIFEDHQECNSSRNEYDAKKICKILGIPHYTFNVEENFKKYVIHYFFSEYQSGKTPNPCVICNRYVKFEGLLDKADELGIKYISTGHYSQIEKEGERFLLKKGKDKKKDQSYFLYNLSPNQLPRSIFPVGGYTKEEVREIAKNLNLPTSSKADSQEVCFIQDNDYKGYLKKNSTKVLPQGEFVDREGNILGYHKGISDYTIGQRRNLGVITGEAMYVVSIDSSRNQIVLGSNKELLSKELIASNLNWVKFETLKKELSLEAKIRYRAKEAKVKILPISKQEVKVIFKTPQRAITKGQAVVFYDQEYVVGGGIIQ